MALEHTLPDSGFVWARERETVLMCVCTAIWVDAKEEGGGGEGGGWRREMVRGVRGGGREGDSVMCEMERGE